MGLMALPKGSPPSHRSRGARSNISCFYYVPVFNIFYDLLFDSAPSLGQLNECMGTYGLISGLMVTVAQAVMNSLETGDSLEYLETDYGRAYTAFKFWAPTGFALLSASMLAVVVHYLASSCSDVDSMSPEVFQWWWFFVRGNVAITLLLTIFGLTGVMMAAYKLFILQHAHSDDEAMIINGFTSRILCGGVMGIAGVSAPWLLMSLGLACSKWAQSKHEELPLTAEYVYEQLELYQQSCPDGNFFCMDKESFLKWISSSLGPHRSITSMSNEFAGAAFDAFKQDEMQQRLRPKITIDTPFAAMVAC